MIPAEARAAWRKEQGQGMISAVGEYTPAEFWELLDAYEAALAVLEEVGATIAGTLSGRGYREHEAVDSWTPDVRREVQTLARVRRFLGGQPVPVALFIAEFVSRHFTFEGVGASEAEAVAQCMRALDAHTALRDCEPGWWHEGQSRDDAGAEFRVRRFALGDAFIEQWLVPAETN